MVLFRQAFHDVARLVDLAALDRSGRTNGAADRLRQRFRTVDDEQSWDRWVEPARDQVVQQGLNRCGVLGRPFHQRQRMLVAFAVNPDRGDQHEIVAKMQPVDLDHEKVERGQIGSHEVRQPRRRQRHKPPRGRRLRNPRSGRCRHVTLGQPDSAAEPARRHIDQHQVHCPATEPILLRSRPSSGS